LADRPSGVDGASRAPGRRGPEVWCGISDAVVRIAQAHEWPDSKTDYGNKNKGVKNFAVVAG
jgi:hypothetical protein